jgi:hypothetical protein|nr:MAG TPA: hypothetical protein [Crassvirales sp.]
MGTNTGLGIGIGIPFKNNALGGDKPYFPPELKARMIGVWTNYGKKNTDTDRNIIKNKIPNAGGDLEILNAAYKLNSGFGEYSEDFTTWTKSSKITSVDSESFDFVTNVNWNLLYYKSNIGKDIPSFKVRIKLKGEGKVFYNYITSEGVYTNEVITSEEYVTPISYNTKYTGETPVNCGFSIGITSEERSGTITQIPNFEDAFVTDGINDMIVSQKTLQEMGVTKELTIVSMIHQISWRGSASVPLTNYIRPKTNEYVRSYVSNIGKTGIYGYVCYDISNSGAGNSHVVNTILGDKNDYSINIVGDLSQGKFSVQGYIDDNGNILETSSVAHYWTFAVLGKATEDEINLIIGNYNLDRSLKPDILCNISKQGITNDNHAEFNDKLIDYSGNGRDIQMNNLAWKGGSGIAAKPFETIKDYSIIPDEARQELTIYNEFCYKIKSNTLGYYWTVQSIIKNNTSYQVIIVTDKDCYWVNATSFINSEGNKDSIRKEYPVQANTPTQVIICGLDQFEYPEGIEPTTAISYVNLKYAGEITVTFIPSHKGGLLLDGITDYGKVTGLPIYKDYTVVADYERFYLEPITRGRASILSKSSKFGDGSFIFNSENPDGGKACYTFGKANGNISDDITRIIRYQSKYYNTKTLSIGTAEDNDFMVLGKVREVDSRYFCGAIYSLMSFPYSMSEFLIERQLKKHKLGTLYPDMVEFRPVIKSSVELVNKPSFAIRGTSTLLNAGDYIPENSEIWVVITMNNAADRITKFVINGNTIDIPSSAYNPSTMKYGFPFTIDNKSPQKITMTIEQDENYVKFEPVITSNVEYVRLDFYLNNYQKRINIGDYIPKDAYLRANFYLKNNVDELTVFTFNGVNIGYRRSSVDDTAFNINQIYNYDSPQEVNITIDEYIRYEDIVQPYPSFVKLENLDRTYTYTWGDKLKVGDTIRYNSSVNLLEGAYTLKGQLECNGVYVYDNNQYITVAKEMIFAWTNSPIWSIDDNEPKCILSPRLLRIPNSSYKILGYIPDISGHGNHGKINNSAYAGASGANGYLQNFSEWTKASGVSSTDSVISSSNNLVAANGWIAYVTSGTVIPTFKVEISGIPVNGNLRFEGSGQTLVNGVNTIQGITTTKVTGFYISSGYDNDWSNLKIEQIGEYEGAYCLDGVDDFVTIPTVTGGKQVLMKVNWDSSNPALLYDQRGYNNNEFAIYNGSKDSDGNPIPAYQGRNNGQTYIDGILNSNIKASELRAITHNITITNELSAGVNKFSPVIGSNRVHNAYFTNMALYDFMLFDEISTDDKIKELNKYVGIEAKVELPPYYWDTYGKTNLDADKATIQQRGVAIGDYDLTNYNHVYEGMSGYNGYPIILSGTNRTYQDKASYVNVVGDDKNVINLTRISFNTAAIFSYVKQNGVLTSYNKDIESFKIKVTGIDYSRFVIKYSYISEANATAKTTMTIASDSIYELPKSFASDGSLTSSDIWIGINFTKQSNDIPDIIEDVNVTIEVLPEYENGLVYDGVEDYSENVNIPIVDDFTFLVKASLLKGFTGSGGLIARKGDVKHVTSGGYAFVYCLDSSSNEANRNSYYSFGKALLPSTGAIEPPLIGYMTKTSVNGVATTFGTNPNIKGINFGDWNGGRMSMVVYKSILYPKTIPLLQINFLKNLMEKDEIIDLTNPIFIKNE